MICLCRTLQLLPGLLLFLWSMLFQANLGLNHDIQNNSLPHFWGCLFECVNYCGCGKNRETGKYLVLAREVNQKTVLTAKTQRDPLDKLRLKVELALWNYAQFCCLFLRSKCHKLPRKYLIENEARERADRYKAQADLDPTQPIHAVRWVQVHRAEISWHNVSRWRYFI